MTDDDTETDGEAGDALERRLRRLPAFLSVMVVVDVVGFGLDAALVPPDPYTQLLVVVPTLLGAPLVAYWAVYREGWRRVAGRVGAYSR